LAELSPAEIRKLEEKAREELPENLKDIPAFVRMQMRLIIRRDLEVVETPLFSDASKVS